MEDEQQGLDKLKKIIPVGIPFGVSTIQRRLRWGFNRAYRTFEFAIATGQATRVKTNDLYNLIKFIKEAPHHVED